MKSKGGNTSVRFSCLRSLRNITTLTRNNQSGTAMDNLTYHYAMDKAGNILNNRLLHVNDAANTTDGTDIKDQGGNYTQQRASTHNYAYDEVGNLIKDKSEEIAEIRWTVTGKVSDVIRANGSSKPDLHFDYDAMGQRIAKTVTNKNVTTGDKFVTTYYVREPQGNVLAVYEHKHGDSDNGTFTLAEQHLYGAGRLGMRKRDLALNATNTSETPATYYELTNHLGNVMAVISDKASDTNEPTVVSLSDYYPFGMTEPGRSWNPGDYRFGYTGHEKESDLAEGVYTTEYRLLDTRLGRWMSVDKMHHVNSKTSAYSYCGGNPIVLWDPDGRIRCRADGTVNVDYTSNVVSSLIQVRLNQIRAMCFAGVDMNDPEAVADATSEYGKYASIYSSKENYRYGVAYTDDDTPFLVMEYTGTKDVVANSSNCFGSSLLGGQLWIPSGFDAQVILNDEYTLSVQDGTWTNHRIIAEIENGSEAASSMNDVVVFYSNTATNMPDHAAEIISLNFKSNEYCDVLFYHKNGAESPWLHGWNEDLKNVVWNPQAISDNTTALTELIRQEATASNINQRDVQIYRRKPGYRRPADVRPRNLESYYNGDMPKPTEE